MIQNTSLSVVREIVANLRRLGHQRKISSDPAIKEIFREFRKHDLTDEKTCRARRELLYMAKTYSKYLESVLKYRQLNMIYSKGEASIEEAARKVGLQLFKSDN